MKQTSLSNQPLTFGRESLTFTFSRLNAKLNEANNGRMKSQNCSNETEETAFERCKGLIDNSREMQDLLYAWSIIKFHHLFEDEILMAWYDFKYNLIGNI
jgi:hypothetical protein